MKTKILFLLVLIGLVVVGCGDSVRSKANQQILEVFDAIQAEGSREVEWHHDSTRFYVAAMSGPHPSMYVVVERNGIKEVMEDTDLDGSVDKWQQGTLRCQNLCTDEKIQAKYTKVIGFLKKHYQL